MSKRFGWTAVGVIVVTLIAGAAYGLASEGMDKYAPPEKSALPVMCRN